MSNSITSGVSTERNETDKSLNVERDRTNETLAADRHKAEGNADKTIANERLEADQAKKSQRKETDLSDSEKLHGLNSPDYDLSSKKASDKRIQAEREESDTAVFRERSRIDSAIGKERRMKDKIITDLLSKERGQTDINLNKERERTDAEVLNSASKLVSEVAAHLQTQTALTTRDEFLAIVSHDLKNPIGLVMSCANILLEDAEEKKFDADTLQSIQMIKRNAAYALRLITDILDIERGAQGKLELNFDKVNSRGLLEEVVVNFTYLADEKNVRLTLVGTNEVPDLLCDRDRTLQILSNIVGNALKFTPKGGRVELSAICQNDCIEFSIRDSGPGIPENKLETIFSRFSQLNSTNRTGLGLGLYISKMFVEKHHGKIWAEAGQQTGSVFHVRMPINGPKLVDLH